MIFGILLIVLGLAAVYRAGAIAQRNREFIDGAGEETYFEQRRAAKAYPWVHPTSAPKVKIGGWIFVAIGSALLLNSLFNFWSK